LPGGDFLSTGTGVSADGSVVVGSSQTESDTTAYRWTAGSTMMALGTNERQAGDVSADGSVVVGSLRVGQDPSLAYRWTAQTGSTTLPTLPRPRLFSAAARAVTPDGSVVVGYNEFRVGLSGIDQEAFRWTQQEGTTSLKSAGWSGTFAQDVSGDGSAVVGGGFSPTGSTTAFYWTPETGMVDLRDLLIFGGATNLDGWHLTVANGISADGRTVVGTALGATGQHEAFVATIGAIPEPASIVLATFAVAGVFGLVLLRRPPTRRSPAQPYLTKQLNPVFQERDHG
jgi:probable HAF family extracellular repeat protein